MKPEVLAEALKTIFSEFGNVVEIVAKRNLKAKGQAFIVFDQPTAAHNAIDEVEGFELFGKPMRVAMARMQSDKTVEMNGNPDEFEAHKRHRQAEKGKRSLNGPDRASSVLTLLQTSARPSRQRTNKGISRGLLVAHPTLDHRNRLSRWG